MLRGPRVSAPMPVQGPRPLRPSHPCVHPRPAGPVHTHATRHGLHATGHSAHVTPSPVTAPIASPVLAQTSPPPLRALCAPTTATRPPGPIVHGHATLAFGPHVTIVPWSCAAHVGGPRVAPVPRRRHWPPCRLCEGDTETRPLVYEDTPRQR